MTDVPEMSDLYRQLIEELTAKFGGDLDEANADAIAYAAAELYHRNFEPRLWEEKSAHDVLDLFGVPRAGVFAPYSLADRLVVFQRRSTRTEYVNRAHDVLTALGVPRQDATGSDYTLKTRLDMFQSRSGGMMAEEQLTTVADGTEQTATEAEVAAPPDGADAPAQTVEAPQDESRAEETPAEDESSSEAPADAEAEAEVSEQPEPEPEPAGDRQPEPFTLTGLATPPEEVADDGRRHEPETEGSRARVVQVLAEAAEAVRAEEAEEPAAAGSATQIDDAPAEVEEQPAEERSVDDEQPSDGEVQEIVEEAADVEILTELPVAGLVEEELPEDELTAGNGNGLGTDNGQRDAQPLKVQDIEEDGPTSQDAGLDVTDAPGAAPLVEAVRALEQAARVEAELAEVGPEGPGGVDLVRLSSTLNGLQAEMVALRTMVESLGNELRERLEAIHEEVLTATGVLQPSAGGGAAVAAAPGGSPADQITRVLPPVQPDTPAEPKKRLRRVWLIVLLVLVGLLLAGMIVLLVVFGWDRIQSEVSGVVSVPASLFTAHPRGAP